MGDKTPKDEECSLDGADLARVLTSMASAIKPLEPGQESLVTSSPFSPPTPSSTPTTTQEHNYNLDTGQPESPASRKRVRKEEMICKVCGDRALGYNFSAITCESCKAFFRRNALKPKPECLFQQQCVIDLRTRRFCPACRLSKCFNIGMDPVMIMDDSEKKARKERVVENRSKKYTPAPATPSACSSSETSAATSSVTLPPSGTGTGTGIGTATSHQSDDALILGRQFGLPLSLHDRMFRHPPRELLPSDPQFYRRLTEDEKWILNDISTAFQATIAVFGGSEPPADPFNSNPSLNELINSTDETVRQLIRFVGRVGDFQQMRKDDQISCLKNSVMQSVLLRSACVYILEKDVFLCSKGEVPTSYLHGALDNPALCTAHVNFCRSIKSIVLNNYTLWALAQILALFNPCGAAILDRETLSSLQDKYVILLKHYLESEFAFTFAHHYLLALQDMLSQLKTLGEAYTKVIYNVNPTEIEPLLLEVFNLK